MDDNVTLSRVVTEQVRVVLAYRSCVRRGPSGHYNATRCFEQGTQGHGFDKYGDRPITKEEWCDGCTAFVAFSKGLDK